MLAALTGADLCPVHLSFTDDGWRQVIHPPLQLPGTRLAQQVREGTQLLADVFARGSREYPQDWHMLQPLWLADLPARAGPMRVGLVCPYSFDVPGGVQAHVADLARTLIALGHHVSVLAPGTTPRVPPISPISWSRPAAACRFPTTARSPGCRSAPCRYTKVRRWIRAGRFDVLHVHEPVAPSLSFLALMVADGPIVATFHTANPRSRMLNAFQGVLQPFMEKITGRIAVSELARQVQVEHLGGDAVIIPNGVDVQFFAGAEPLPGYPREGGTVGFIGRFDEPRKGMEVLLDALRLLVPDRPGLRLLVAGSGDEKDLREAAGPELAGALRSWAGCPSPTRRRCSSRSTCTAHPIPAARASGSSSPSR